MFTVFAAVTLMFNIVPNIGLPFKQTYQINAQMNENRRSRKKGMTQRLS
jgi:hypothetical protein